MCFSAEASFATGALLMATGIGAIKKTTLPSQLMFAAIPLVFAVQQITEGFLWISFNNSEYQQWNALLTHVFLFFAQVVWPVWVPLAFLLIEINKRKRKILTGLTIIGGLSSAYLFYCLITYTVNSRISTHHIYYDVDYPDLYGFGVIFYFVPTVIPPFISWMKWAWILGSLNLVTLIISKIFFRDNVISVWCFMAAIISAIILVMIIKTNKKIQS
jgi:hypothetical protein